MLFEKGNLVTVSKAHPDHKKFVGLVIDKVFTDRQNQIYINQWSNIDIPERIPPLVPNRWYYLILGPSFIKSQVPTEQLMIHIFVQENLEKYTNDL